MEAVEQGVESFSHEAPQSNAVPVAEDVETIGHEQMRIVNLKASHLDQHRIVAYNKADSVSWVFDLLRTQILQKMDEMGWRTLAITSPIPEAGKTVVSINLAMSIAHSTTKTSLLVDFDLRRPKVASYLGLTLSCSLNEVLDGKAELQEAMINPGIPRLVVLPTSGPVANPSETLSSTKVANLIKEMRDRYASRIVIFDLPPLLNSDDAIAVLPQIDCVLLVVGEGMSSDKEIEQCLRYLPSANLLGTVLNKAEDAPKAYYY